MPTVNFYNSELMAQQSSDPLWLNMVRIGLEVPTMPRTSFTTSIYYFTHFNFQANMTSWCTTFYLWPLKFISNAVFKDSKLFLCFSWIALIAIALFPLPLCFLLKNPLKSFFACSLLLSLFLSDPSNASFSPNFFSHIHISTTKGLNLFLKGKFSYFLSSLLPFSFF